MAKGLYIFDSEAKEFRRRDSVRPWDLRDDMASIDNVESNKPVALSQDEKPGDQEVLSGFVDPMRLRRRRSKKTHSSKPGSIDSVTRKWQYAMWILIAVMAVTWLLMVYMHSREARQFPQNEKFFRFDRQDILNE